MKFFRRKQKTQAPAPPAPAPEPELEPEPAPEPIAEAPGPDPEPVAEVSAPAPEPVAVVPEPAGEDIRVKRTLVKSQPELDGLIASDPRFHSELVDVELTESGFGTSVAISARPAAGLAEADLQSMLDSLGEDHRRPFTNS